MCGCSTSVTYVNLVNDVDTSCFDEYASLQELDVQVINLYKEDRSRKELLGINKLTRQLMNNLKRECPKEEDLRLIREKIDEYS